MKIRFVIKIIIVSLIATLLSGCKGNINKSVEENDKIKVITTLFPQYDFAKNVGKDKVDVSLLLLPGVEAHSYEPTPKDIINIENADVFIYTGDFMEPWAKKIIDSIKNKELIVVDTSKGISLIGQEHGDEHEDEDNHGGKDPHIWLDPMNAQKMVDNILEGIIKADEQNKDFYYKNGNIYKDKLNKLDADFIEAFKNTKSDTIVYGGHFAFGYFTKRYGLDHVSPYSGFSPDAEPSPKRIIELIDTINSSGVKTIYYEELIEPKVADIIAKETGAKMLLLHGAHNISKEELKSGITYIQIMEGNLERLKEGLGYEE